MRIIYIENEDINSNFSGGITTYLFNLIKYCNENNLESYLFINGQSDKSNFVSLADNNAKNNLRFFLDLFKNPKIKLLKETDIAHVQRSEMVIPLWFRTKAKIVCTLHGGQDKAVFVKKGIFQWLLYFVLQTIGFLLADYLIAVDSNNKRRYCKYYPWIKNKITVIPIGIDISKFDKQSQIITEFSTEKKNIIFIGRLEPEKNISFLIDVFKEVYKENNQTNFIIIGSGSEEEKLKTKAKEFKLENIFFLGSKNNNEIINYLSASNVLVLSSIFEGSPTVIKEALVCKVPIVSSDVGDVKDVLNKVSNGGFISEMSINDFKEKIILALSISKQDVLVNKEDFSLTEMGKNTIKVYKNIYN